MMIEPDNLQLTISKQCEILGLSRSGYYYKPAKESDFNLSLMLEIDAQYTITPYFGSRKMAKWLNRQRFKVNRKRIKRLMRLMGIEAIYPKPKTSCPHPQNKIYPYLLRNLPILYPNQVWSSDITYIPMQNGFMYLVAIMDLFSRYVLSWEISNTLDSDFCVVALKNALSCQKPEIFNTDQGVQFTSKNFIEVLESHDIRVSMDGKGRFTDNIFIERLWRSLKYEDIYIKNYEKVVDLYGGVKNYFQVYNQERPHQALEYLTPEEQHLGEILPK